jgi:hypothetical protein
VLRHRRPDPRASLVERQRARRARPRRRSAQRDPALADANLGATSIYLQGIETEEIIATVHARRAPMMSATAGLQL